MPRTLELLDLTIDFFGCRTACTGKGKVDKARTDGFSVSRIPNHGFRHSGQERHGGQKAGEQLYRTDGAYSHGGGGGSGVQGGVVAVGF